MMKSSFFRRWTRRLGRTRLQLRNLEERLAPAGGQLDTSFATGGIAVTPFPEIASAEGGNSVAVDSQQRVLVAGFFNNGFSNSVVVARYLANGTLDSSFGTGGLASSFLGAGDNNAFAVTVDFLDRVVVTGYALAGNNYEMAVARLTTAGNLDAGFSGDGITTISFGSTQAFGTGVAVDSLNRVVVAGYALVGTKYDVAVARLTAAGALDTTFSGDGLHLVDFNGGDDFGTGVAIDSTNRPIISVNVGGATTAVGAMRLTTGGALDTTFDGDGRQTVTFAAGNEFSYGIAVDNADQPLVVGHTDPTGTNRSFAVARLTTGGVLDSTFDLDGKQTVAFASPVQPRGIQVDSMNRVVLIGSIVNSGQNDYAVARLNAAGGLDPAFNGTGQQIVAITANNDLAQAITVDFFDRVIVAGRARPVFTDDIAVARLTTGGLLDLTFNGTGIQTTALTRQIPLSAAQASVVDSMGRVVVVGFVSNGPENDFAAIRYLSTGAVDTSFGTNGYVSIDFGGTQDFGNSVALDSLGRIVIAGYTQSGSSLDFAVTRLTSTGQIDMTFDTDGRQTIVFGTGNEIAYSVAVDSMNRVIVAGTATGPSGNNFAVACLTSTGALDASFNGDGRRVFAFGAGQEFGRAVTVDSMDRIVVAGYAESGSHNDFAIARLNGNGQFDTSFNGTGQRTIDFGGTDDYARGVAIDSQNRVVVVGDAGNISSGMVSVARLTSAGNLDSTFSTDGQTTMNFAGTFDRAAGVKVDAADRPVLAGSANNGSNTDFVVARLTAGGDADALFNGTGQQSVSFASGTVITNGLALDQLGRPIVVGTTQFKGVNVFTTTRFTNPAQVVSIAVDSNSGHRSLVRSMKVEFGTQVSFVGSPASAFQLTHQGTMTNVVVAATVDPSGHSVTLTFSGAGVETSGSLADGRYTLTIFADQFTGTGFEGGGMNNNYVEVGSPTSTHRLFRLFGDSNGDGTVSAADFNAFRLAYGAGPSIFDFDGDNATTATDFNAFRLRYGTAV